MTKYYTANVDPSCLIVVTNRAGTVAPGKCRVRQATKEELDELLGPVDKSILAPKHGRKRRPKSGQRKKPPSGRP